MAVRPRLLDLFCGAGGAAMGYHRAGFDVVGVDLLEQPHYPFPFWQADAIDQLTQLAATGDDGPFWPSKLGHIDAIHASPPCQRYVRSGMFDRSKHPDMLPLVRSWLEYIGLPWVIENVPGAPMRADLKLCGCMFGLGVRRERWFETSWHAFDLRQPCYHPDPPVGVYGHPRGGMPGQTAGWGSAADWGPAMGIDWMTTAELAQAIPPEYTRFIGETLRKQCSIPAIP